MKYELIKISVPFVVARCLRNIAAKHINLRLKIIVLKLGKHHAYNAMRILTNEKNGYLLPNNHIAFAHYLKQNM